ncbi:MAG: hypothetical protein OQK58_09965 [Gammaproteobacteria bacterium]|nr:hypothetical protein [Gammaproteobacteria bacterium]
MINKILPIYIVLLLGSLSLFSCSEPDEADILNQRIDSLVSAIEKHDEKGIKEFLSKDFSAKEGLNKTQFFLFARYHFKRNKNVVITIIDKEVRLNKEQADVTAKVLLIGASEWLPERGQFYNVASRWQKESGDWVMSRLRWEVEGKQN